MSIDEKGTESARQLQLVYINWPCRYAGLWPSFLWPWLNSDDDDQRGLVSTQQRLCFTSNRSSLLWDIKRKTHFYFFAFWCLHQQKLLLFFWRVNTLLLLVPTLITWRRKRSRRSPCLVPDLSVLLHHPESWTRTFLDSSSVHLSTVYLILIWRLGWRGRDRFQLSSVPSGPGSRHHRNSHGRKKESRCLRQLVQSCDIFFFFFFFFCRSAPNVKIVAQSFTALPIFLSLSVCVQPALWSMPVRFPSLGDALCALRKVRVLLNRLSKSSMYSTTILLLFRLVARRWWIDLFICFTSLSHSAEWWIRWPTGHESAVACWPMQL